MFIRFEGRENFRSCKEERKKEEGKKKRGKEKKERGVREVWFFVTYQVGLK